MPTTTDFTGFGPDSLDFLDGLAADNSKSYFDANRTTYDEQLATPMKALVVDVAGRLAAEVSPGVVGEPKVGKSLFRINRDLRFSKDKTPYNPYVDAVFWEGASPRTSPSFILRVAPAQVVVGAGVVGLDQPALVRWRDSVVDEGSGTELVQAIVEIQRSVKGAELSEPTRARVPKGYRADHPRAELLRRDAVHLSVAVDPPVSLTSARFVSWLVDRYAKFAPLHRWLVEHVGDGA